MTNAPAVEDIDIISANPLPPTVEEENFFEATPLADFVPADEEVTAAPEKDEMERLLEDPSGPFALASGTAFNIRQLRLRELLRLLRIVTRGASMAMPALNFNFENPDEFVQSFLALVVFSIPEAEDETVDFVQSMVDPILTGHEETDARSRLALLNELENPELDDIITIITIIIATEGRDLAALGKRLRSMLSVARKMGQVPEALTPSTAG